METGRVFNVQRFAVHDGPGIRTTVFLKGCPARCLWCHNPESQSGEPQIVRYLERCLHCGGCEVVCPNGLDEARCTTCGACVEACPAESRQLAGRTMTVAEVMAEVEPDRIFYDDSGGGVTFSGGEPLSQPAFLRALLLAARAARLSTAVDTCGAGSRDQLLSLAGLVDVFLYDLKIMDPARHLEFTGLPLAPVVANLEALGAVHGHIWVRVPIVPGLTDDEACLSETARLAASVPGVRRVHLLPYHAIGAAKFGRLGKTYALDALKPPSAERMAALADVFRTRGLDTRIGG
jgi:pyruvate formate lyase activating enzyme